MLKENFYIKSARKNCYHFSLSTGLFSLIHPITYEVASLSTMGYDKDHITQKLASEYNESDIEYYYNYYLWINRVYPSSRHINCSKQLTKEAISDTLCNLKQLVFEVTTACNLRCEYCGYGNLYENYDSRHGEKLSLKNVKTLVDYLLPYWANKKNNEPIYISFYGGEPLLNITLIKDIVELFEKLDNGIKFVFSMTTNAIYLHRYIDYLVDKDFKILISLDGNKDNNAYRIKANHANSYDDVIKNILLLKSKYPDYYLSNVNFNSVLHDKNNISDILSFFDRELEKTPSVSSLNTTGVREDMIEKFNEVYRDLQDDINNADNTIKKREDMFLIEPDARDFSIFTTQLNRYSNNNINEHFEKTLDVSIFPGGTCIPFSRKLFLTVNGKILPCERIGQNHALGKIDHGAVHLDFEKICSSYNSVYKRMDKVCSSCYRNRTCSQCMFHMPSEGGKNYCGGHLDAKGFEEYLKTIISRMENHPWEYKHVLENVKFK